MNDKNITRIKVTSDQLPEGKTDWNYLDSLNDDDAENAALSGVDAQPVSKEGLKKFHRVVKVKFTR